MSSVEDFELRLIALEQLLRPIADEPVDITQPGWAERLVHSPHPLDRAGVRLEAESLLEDVLQFYQAAAEDTRLELRNLFQVYRAFSWAASLSYAPTTEDYFRRHLLLFALKDQGRDSRDALLLLQDLCRQAKSAGVSLEPVLREVAELCSSNNRFAMGSTRDMLLRMC